MARDPRVPIKPTVAENAVSEQRRRILKVAATAAPVIATLPSGAAFANASVHQCVVHAAEREQAPADGFLYIPARPDDYVRAEAIKETWTDSSENERMVIGWPVGAPTKWWMESDNGLLGHWVSFNPADPGDWTKIPSSEEKVNTLLLWSVDDQGTGFDGVGMWPAQQQAQGTAFGVVQSCLCSVDPGISPWCV
jgi:hypothetical protein